MKFSYITRIVVAFFIVAFLGNCSILEPIMAKKKPLNTVFIDSTQMDETFYNHVQEGIKLEIFFLEKGFFSYKAPAFQYSPDASLQEPFVKQIKGHHTYTITPFSTISDQIVIHRATGRVCVVASSNGQVVHMQTLRLHPSNAKSIHIRFVGRDMYVQHSR